MKKTSIILSIILMICMIPAPAHAAGFYIDDQHIYEGMDQTYREGYAPLVQNGTATIILPLVADGAMGDTITASPNLGDPETSPFVFRNYQKTAYRARYEFESGRANAYLIRFDLRLSPDRVNGVYPVTIAIQGKDGSGGAVQQSFTSYVTITDGKAEARESSSQPKIIVDSYSIDPSPVTAGDSCMVRITLKNTSETQSVQNMTVTVACDSPNFALQNDSDTIFIGSLGKGKTTDIELTYKTDLETPAQRYHITLAMSYEDADAQALSSPGTVAIDVSQELRVELETPQLPSQVYAGDTFPLSIKVINMGRSKVYNVRAEINVPGLLPNGMAFVGNMDAGTEMTGETNVFIGTKDMSQGHENDPKYGLTNGTITLIYEDTDGQEYTQTMDFTTTIQEPVVVQTGTPEEEPVKAGQWWASVLIGITIIVGLTAVLIIRRRRRAEHEND